ncbi:MAG: cyclic lactone autoinducer peptide [Clostridium sp.]|nr:cyclic lactone autoinducer peptide [Clostridium sp.]MCM1171057.1 cyclic lactone autoinducer peptide [Clostridium sp.]MCM1208924.1 cyclic lactone autoinducer peptide [Ruminococcus sp.]
MAEKKVRKNKAAEKLAGLLTRELKHSANSAGSMLVFQPKIPAGLKRFQK